MIHEMQAKFLRSTASSDQLPITLESIDTTTALLDEIVDEVSRTYAEELAPAIERIWDDSVAAITPTSISHGVKASRRMMVVSCSSSANGTVIAIVTMKTTYTIVDTPMAPKVPTLILLDGVSRSPDIATPWVNPVTAGKKIAKLTQNEPPPGGVHMFSDARPGSRSSKTPTK